MFNVKRIKTGEILQVLDTTFDEMFHKTYFLVWENNAWRWRDSKNFVPPNVEIKTENMKK